MTSAPSTHAHARPHLMAAHAAGRRARRCHRHCLRPCRRRPARRQQLPPASQLQPKCWRGWPAPCSAAAAISLPRPAACPSGAAAFEWLAAAAASGSAGQTAAQACAGAAATQQRSAQHINAHCSGCRRRHASQSQAAFMQGCGCSGPLHCPPRCAWCSAQSGPSATAASTAKSTRWTPPRSDARNQEHRRPAQAQHRQ